MDEMDAEFIMDIIAHQNILDGPRVIGKKSWLYFIGWKLIVPKVVFSRGQALGDSRKYKSDDCWRSAKVGGTCKPGTMVCLITEIAAIVVVERDTMRLEV
jgi:hypothetical protein